VGLHTITVSAKDNVANLSTPVTYTYRVVYNLCETQNGTNLWIQLCDAKKVVQQFSFKSPPTALLYSSDGSEAKATKDPGFGYSFKCLVSPGGSACPTSGTGAVTLQYQQLPTGTHQIAFTVSADPVTAPGTWTGPPAALPFDVLRLYVFTYKM
jgi:hypothetical protein